MRSGMSTLDRLSVRTEVTPGQNNATTTTPIIRKPVALPNEDTINTNERLLYFSPNESEPLDTVPKSSKVEVDESLGQDIASSLADVKSGPSSASSLHDTILATQLRHINREMTPTISEVYHERNIGLGLAPPLSKLLLNQTSNLQPTTDNSVLDKIKLGILEDGELEKDIKRDTCQRCKSDNCTCRSKTMKPWLSETVVPLQQIQSSDLTTADILEREAKNKKWQSSESRSKETGDCDPKRLSPFSEMSRRDEGDGRSIADSQCSSSYNKRATGYRSGPQTSYSLATDKATGRLRSAHAQVTTQRNRNTQN